MSISLSRYVEILSGVAAGAAVAERELIGRFFDDNALIPTGGEPVEFTDAASVAAYFGAGTPEAQRAALWFDWISKDTTNAQKISFSRWVSAASAPQIFGAKGGQSLANWTGITAGTFHLIIGGVNNTIGPINFSAAGSLSAVAALVQAAIHAQSGSQWTSSVVTYDAVRGSFDFTGGVTGAATIAVATGGGSDIAGQLGWLSPSTILSNGAAIQTITEVLDQANSVDDNFGSFAFVATLDQAQIVEAATWNDAQNDKYMYSVPCTTGTASSLAAALASLGGVTLTLDPQVSGEFPEQAPMMIMAATDYTARNSVQNYMFQIFPLTPSVTTDADANTYDALGINYYGQTQSAGNRITFYQRGTMYGTSTDALDQNTYANEVWLKSAMEAQLMSLLLALARISANTTGKAQVLAAMQDIINQAVFNGTISIGKTLTAAQKLYITQATGDNQAWIQVINLGYWVTAEVVPYVESGVTKYKIVYTLIYGKDDIIRKIEGRDIMI